MAWYVDGLDDGRIRRWTSIAVDDDDADNEDVDLDTGGDVDGDLLLPLPD